ncbi:MAG: 2Fe-2S iron-sulfur cluster-binding protein [Halieaceae bacterium]|jgi:2Fe-2S ferredoxin|nr:2Fe-2S iron-sulfur cluster-binding protein [Halieaceae bacterium]
MPTIIYVEHDGTRHEVELEEQVSLMEGAIMNMVPGVEGMCGGVASCATCHCYIEEPWASKLHERGPQELHMLSTAKHRKDSSRLGCQVLTSWEMEGMEVHLPPEQGSEPAS